MVKDISTPYYLIDQERLIQNMQFMKQFANLSKTRLLLALKCFAVPFVFPDMKRFLYGTTSSSLYEMREPIKSSIGKIFKSLASSMVVLFGLHSLDNDLMIFLTFSLFEKVFPRAPRVFTMSVNLVYIEYTFSFCSIWNNSY